MRKKVIATGTFSLLHPGHLLFLKEAKKLGDQLIVIVARDRRVAGKKSISVIPEQQRLELVKGIKYVDRAVLGDEEDIFRPIREIDPDIIALGKDQEFKVEELEKELGKQKLGEIKVIRIDKYWPGELNSSQRIVRRIKAL